MAPGPFQPLRAQTTFQVTILQSPHGPQRGEKTNKTLPIANFSKPEVVG